MTLDEYEYKITEMLKIKLTNYRLTSNDIAFLLEMVYADIATKVNIAFHEATLTVDSQNNLFDINPFIQPEERLKRLVAIKDYRGNDISKFFIEDSQWVYKIDHYLDTSVDDDILKVLDGKDITFIHSVIPDVSTLSDEMYMEMYNAIIAGIMYHAHDSIPSPTSSNVPFNETGMYKTLYDNEIAYLVNRLPQIK